MSQSPAPTSNTIRGAGANGRPIVFFDIAIGDSSAGRIKMELFSDVVPKYVVLLTPPPQPSTLLFFVDLDFLNPQQRG